MQCELIILANSIKHKQCCVAGKTMEGKWIRVVANHDGKELTNAQAVATNPYGTYPVKPLQRVILKFISHAPLINQPENYIVDNNFLWKQNYNINKSTLIKSFLDTPSDILGTGDRIGFNKIESQSIIINNSLFLVKINKVIPYINQFEKRRLKFEYNTINYDFPVTTRSFKNLIMDEELEELIVCISLGENYDGFCYKIVAHIFN